MTVDTLAAEALAVADMRDAVAADTMAAGLVAVADSRAAAAAGQAACD